MSSDPSAVDPTGPIFISYRQNDGAGVAAELAWLLRAAGIPVWRDQDDLPPGDIEARIEQAMDAGISGGILVITPDIENSRVVREVEAPRLLELHRDHEMFALGIINSVTTEGNKTDYEAPDQLLGVRPGTLSGVCQQSADRDGMLALIRGLVMHRIAAPPERTDRIFHLSIQTRNNPQVYDRTGNELDIRLRPSDHERLPSPDGLRDLKDTIGILPDAATRSRADRICVSGGAHLSVAFAIGAALPSTRVGHMDVIDNQGATWASDSEARLTSSPQVQIVTQGGNPSGIATDHSAVAVYVDLLPQRSDAAFNRYIEDHKPFLKAWCHLARTDGALLDPADAGLIAADVAAHIRALSNDNANAEVHLLLRCPFPLALLIGRLTNTLRVVLYEWDDLGPIDSDGCRARYVPALRVRASANSGVIEDVLLPDAS